MRASEAFETTDRYKAAGVPYPDPKTMCEGQCEGMGFYPQFLEGPWMAKDAARLESVQVPVIAVEDLPAVLDSGNLPETATATMVEFACPDPTEDEIRLWHEQHALSEHKCDGWHFIKCAECGGTGKRH